MIAEPGELPGEGSPPADAGSWDPSAYQVPPEAGQTRFQDLNLSMPVLRAVAEQGFRYCTPIQSDALPHTLAGRDVFGQAQTGTGKTAAFLITIFEHMLKHPPAGPRPPATPRALVIAPTRELIMQIEKDAVALGRHTGLRMVSVFGGADYDRQKRRMGTAPVDLVVATPGRLLDFHSRHDIHLRQVEILVLDEADRMMDMGFIPDVRRIVYSTPPKERRQTLFFSATLNPDVQRLGSSWTRDPVRIEVEPEHIAVDTVDQRLFIVTAREKGPLLYNLITREKAERVLLFVNRRDTAEKVADSLGRLGFPTALISGALTQSQRTRALEDFRAGKTRVLVATDVAGRGLHIEGVSHVVNYNIPLDPEDYVHRIGRTGRAGASGISVTFACEEESFYLPDIEKYIGRELRGTVPTDDWLTLPQGVMMPDLSETGPRPERPFRGGPRRGGPRGGPRGGSRGGRRGHR